MHIYNLDLATSSPPQKDLDCEKHALMFFLAIDIDF